MRLLAWLAARIRGARAPDPLAGLDPAAVRLVVGLGNPGEQYAATRHNVGFRVVEGLADEGGAPWHDRRAWLHSLVAVLDPAGRTLVLARPTTFMNLSGQSVEALVARLGVPLAQVLVVYDDMDLPFGTLRLRARGSAGTHNGMRSIVRQVGSQDFPRLRIGIGQPRREQAIQHVLDRFSDAEEAALDPILERARQAVRDWAAEGVEAAMNRHNR